MPIAASPSATLRPPWLLAAMASCASSLPALCRKALSAASLFFEPPGPDGFVNRVGQHSKFPPNVRDTHPRIQPLLHLPEPLVGELVALLRLRHTEESRRSLFAKLFASSLHAHQGNPKGPRYLALRREPVGYQLAGEKPE